jgi:hypothetical protein
LKTATIGAILFALLCWAYPISTAAKIPKQKVEQVTTPTNEQDNAKPSKLDDAVHLETHNSGTLAVRKNNSPTTAGYNGRDYSTEEVQQLIKDYSAQYGISADLPLRVANCESGFNSLSKNRSSTASGVFQYIASTWSHTDAGKAGISVFDADANIKMAVSSIAANGTAPWNASRSCWSK